VGREISRTSFLGPFLSISVFEEDDPKAAEKYFSGSRSADASLIKSLQQEVEQHRVSFSLKSQFNPSIEIVSLFISVVSPQNCAQLACKFFYEGEHVELFGQTFEIEREESPNSWGRTPDSRRWRYAQPAGCDAAAVYQDQN